MFLSHHLINKVYFHANNKIVMNHSALIVSHTHTISPLTLSSPVMSLSLPLISVLGLSLNTDTLLRTSIRCYVSLTSNISEPASVHPCLHVCTEACRVAEFISDCMADILKKE